VLAVRRRPSFERHAYSTIEFDVTILGSMTKLETYMNCSRLIALSFLACAPLVACASTPTAQRYDEVLQQRDHEMDIEIHGDSVKACELDTSRTYFSYASSELTEEDRLVLGEVAQCLNKGKLAGKSILITGYTDSVGTVESNADLGMKRSRMVAYELNTRGVPARRIFIRSRGERLAKGDNAVGMALDRKVELRLVERDI